MKNTNSWAPYESKFIFVQIIEPGLKDPGSDCFLNQYRFKLELQNPNFQKGISRSFRLKNPGWSFF